MNGPTHQFAGAVAALAITQVDSDDKSTLLHHPAAAIPIGAFLGRLPDMIEPSLRNPNHKFDKLLRGLLLIGGGAYLSHLALDALTSKSLPLIGKL